MIFFSIPIQNPLPQSYVAPMPSPWVEPGPLKLIWVQSPNYNRRPKDMAVDTIVVHSTVIPTTEKTVLAFCRVASKVSAHYVIGKDGSIVQQVSTFDRAWHAGVSKDVLGRTGLNDFSVGIELVNLDDGKDPYPEAQLFSLRCLIASLKRRFDLKYIASHAYVAQPPGRKVDPMGFPWKSLEGLGLTFEK